MAMICATFTGGEAEELRRALGHELFQHRMKEIEIKLRAGMTQNALRRAKATLFNSTNVTPESKPLTQYQCAAIL